MFFIQRKYSPVSSIKITDENGRPTDVSEKYNPEEVQARVLIVEALGQYADELALLSENDAPERVAKQVQAIGDSISDTSSKIAQMSPTGTNFDPTKFGKPISHIAATAMSLYVHIKKQKYLRKAVLDSKK